MVLYVQAIPSSMRHVKLIMLATNRFKYLVRDNLCDKYFISATSFDPPSDSEAGKVNPKVGLSLGGFLPLPRK